MSVLFFNLRSRPSRLSWRSQRRRLLSKSDTSADAYAAARALTRRDTDTDTGEEREAETLEADDTVGLVDGDELATLGETLLLYTRLAESIGCSARCCLLLPPQPALELEEEPFLRRREVLASSSTA